MREPLRHRGARQPAGRLEVNVGDPWTEDDLRLSVGGRDIEAQTRAHVTLVIAGALIVFYSLYIVHEWWTGRSFESIGRFLETGIWLFIGWCIGKAFPRGREP
jgi:hypothetical protein